MRALLFDLDGTLIDSAYAHAVAWQHAFLQHGIAIDAWRLHRRIGMSGDVLMQSIAEELQIRLRNRDGLTRDHAKKFKAILPAQIPHRGALELLADLRRRKIRFGIASSGARKDVQPSLDALKLRKNDVVVTRDEVDQGKPHADLFEVCRQRLEASKDECFAVGDSVWDALSAKRAGLLFVGLLSGGYGRDELSAAGAYRIYDDAEMMRLRLPDLGLESSK
jgi:HAD superfamily hydrolase (TIGR01549 family)